MVVDAKEVPKWSVEFVDLPINNGDLPCVVILVYQRVINVNNSDKFTHHFKVPLN